MFKGVKLALDAGSFQPVYDALAAAAGGITKYLEGIAAALPAALKQVDYTALINSFGQLGQAVAGLFGDMDLTKPEDLAKALQLIVDGVAKLTQFVSQSVESFGPLIKAFFDLNDKIGAGNSSIPEFLGALGGMSKQFELLSPLLSFAANGMLLLAGTLNVAGVAIKATGEFLEAGLLFRFGQLIGILTQGGLLAAVGAAGYAIGTEMNGDINKLVSTLTGSQTSLGAWIYDITHAGDASKDMAGKVDTATDSTKKLNDEVAKTDAAAKASAAAMEKAAEATKQGTSANYEFVTGLDGVMVAAEKVVNGPFIQWIDAQGNIVKQTEASEGALKKWNDEILKNSPLTKDAANAALGLADTQSKMIPIIDAVTGKIVGYEQNLAKSSTSATGMATATDKAATAAAAAAKAQDDWNHKLIEMKFQEQMQAMKDATTITVASIEADSKKAIAAFDSIGKSVTSTNDLIAKLFSTNAPDWDSFGFNIKKAADQALDIQKKLADEQIKLTEAQIDNLKLKNDLLRQGMPQIIIKADGLEPHIEAFMFQILKRIQVSASQLGAEWLVGGGMVGA